jgi:hypothetical protein
VRRLAFTGLVVVTLASLWFPSVETELTCVTPTGERVALTVPDSAPVKEMHCGGNGEHVGYHVVLEDGREIAGAGQTHEHISKDPWNLALSIAAFGLVAFLLTIMLRKRREGS